VTWNGTPPVPLVLATDATKSQNGAMGSRPTLDDRPRAGFGTQLVQSVAAFESRVGPPGDPRRDDLRTALLWDFGFIPAYWLLFAASSALLALRPFCAAPWLGALAGEIATVAAAFDVQENAHTLQLLRTTGPGAERVIRRMRFASLVKWACAFAATGVLSAGYFDRGGGFYALAGAYAGAAGLGAVAVLLALLKAGDALVDGVLLVAFVVTGLVLLTGVPIGAAYA
jgi:hypothetical protein